MSLKSILFESLEMFFRLLSTYLANFYLICHWWASNSIIIIMQAKEKCSQCMYTFSMQKLPRKLPCCQHSICEPCIREIIETRQDIIICGFCTARVKKEDIRIFSLNTSILLSLSQTPVQVQSIANEEENQLLNDLVPLNFSSISTKQNAVDDLCPLHRAPLDIVCISDQQKICPHCALFGNHREHRFKRLQDFQKEVSEKKRAFIQIQNDKQKSFQNDFYRMGEQLKSLVELKRAELFKLIEDQFKKYDMQLRKRKQTTIHQIDTILYDYQQNMRRTGPINKFQNIKQKLELWQRSCLQILYKLDSTKKVQERLSYYYDGPLEIVAQGHIFIQQLNNCKKQAFTKLKQQVQEIKVKFDQKLIRKIENCVKITKVQFSLAKQLKTQLDQDENDSNPFLDCTSSAIVHNKQSSNFINLNTSLQVEINSISTTLNNDQQFNTPTRKELQIKSIRSIEKERHRMQPSTMTNLKKTLVQTPKSPTHNLKRPISELSFYKSPGKALKSKQKVQNEEQKRQIQSKQPQKIYLQFSKNTLSDFFDLSDCNLSSEKIVEYVHRARRIHKIRGLKLSNNKLTTSGFQKMTEYLQGVSNINAANNLLNQTIFDIILKYRQRLDSLKVINLTHNPINLDKKAISKIQEVKKLNIVVTL